MNLPSRAGEAVPARPEPTGPPRRRWLPRAELLARLRVAQADPGLRDDLARLVGDTTDDLGPAHDIRYICDMNDTGSVRDVRHQLADVVDRAVRDDQITVDVVRQWPAERIGAVLDQRMRSTESGIPMEEVIAETLARPE